MAGTSKEVGGGGGSLSLANSLPKDKGPLLPCDAVFHDREENTRAAQANWGGTLSLTGHRARGQKSPSSRTALKWEVTAWLEIPPKGGPAGLSH